MMRKVLFVLFFALCAIYVNGQRNADVVFSVDTLNNSDTLTFTFSPVLKDIGTICYHVACDSISGTPAGTISYEWSLDTEGTEWHQVATDTISNAASTDQIHIINDFGAYRARIRVISSGTQQVEVSPSISFKRNY